MKLLVLSDLHNEFSVFQPDPSAVAVCDAVVLAGDIDKGTRGITWARQVFGAKPVIYIAGNHEFYEHHWNELVFELREQARACDVHFLENEGIDLQGVRFLGCTLWTDFRFFPNQSVTGAMRASERGMNDFRTIRADPLPLPAGPTAPARVRYGRRLTPQHARVRHRASVAWLREQLQAANQQGIRPVVITHHLPSERSVPPRYVKDELTVAFASRLDEMLPCAQLWIHGHSHESCDYVVAGDHEEATRVVCNPRGYPLVRDGSVFENPTFTPSRLVDL